MAVSYSLSVMSTALVMTSGTGLSVMSPARMTEYPICWWNWRLAMATQSGNRKKVTLRMNEGFRCKNKDCNETKPTMFELKLPSFRYVV